MYFRIIFLILTFNITKSTSIVTFPVSSVTGVLIALAIPIDLPNYNVFMSYNFEANYNLPTQAIDISHGPGLIRTKRDETNQTNVIEENKKENVTRPAFEPLITRKRIYKWIEDKLKVNGYNGKACLLRAICEHVDTSFSRHNGFLGDLAHIVLSPHTSKREPEMEEYYAAELQGETRDCSKNYRSCNTNILDFISKNIYDTH